MSVFGENKSETRTTASVLKHDPNTQRKKVIKQKQQQQQQQQQQKQRQRQQ